MKVTKDVNQAQIQNAQTTSSQKTGATKTKSLEQNLKTDLFKVDKGANDSASVDLSTRAQDMKKAKEIAKNAPDVRADKIKSLQAAIDNGTYKVDAKKVADKMVEDELMNSAAMGD